MNKASLQWILDNCRTILFDFDGPLCDVFAGRPARQIARELERLVDYPVDTNDPLEVLRAVYAADSTLGHVVEDALIRAEVEAVKVSRPEMAGVQALRSFADDGRGVGIVSNNCLPAIEAFVDNLGLRGTVSVIVGRAYRRPDLMKPHPWALTQAVERLSDDLAVSVLIGDSMTDIEAACRAGAQCVAFANKPSKIDEFRATGVATITSMWQLVRPEEVERRPDA